MKLNKIDESLYDLEIFKLFLIIGIVFFITILIFVIGIVKK
jgi:hypothetical protein